MPTMKQKSILSALVPVRLSSEHERKSWAGKLRERSNREHILRDFEIRCR